MTFNSSLRLLVLTAVILAFAGLASAQTVYNTSPSTSNLAVSATVQSALNLDISSDDAGATVSGLSGSGAFTLDFGNVNGLGLGTPSSSNVTKTAVTGGYLYTTPIKLTPNFSGFVGYSAASIKVEQSAFDDDPSKAAAREGSSAAINAATVLTTGATPFTVLASNGTPIQRFIGVKVLNSNNTDNANAGARSINLVYTISVP